MQTRNYIKKAIKRLLIEGDITNRVWYHGSSEPIEKFSFSKIGNNSDRISSYHGYGIYFIDDKERARMYGDVINKITIDNGSDILEGNVTPKQLKKVYDGLISMGVEMGEDDKIWFNNPTYGEYSVLTDVLEFYDFLLRRYQNKLENIKGVSELLLKSGIDGIKVTNDVGDNILVIFNEDVINVV